MALPFELKILTPLPTSMSTDTKAGIMEDGHSPKTSENRLAEILGLVALAIAALVTVAYLLGV